MEPELWTVLDRLMQWLIIPAAAGMWFLNTSVSKHDREILRILTILEERNHRRDEDRDDNKAAFEKLYTAIEHLTEKIDSIGARK